MVNKWLVQLSVLNPYRTTSKGLFFPISFFSWEELFPENFPSTVLRVLLTRTVLYELTLVVMRLGKQYSSSTVEGRLCHQEAPHRALTAVVPGTGSLPPLQPLQPFRIVDSILYILSPTHFSPPLFLTWEM